MLRRSLLLTLFILTLPLVQISSFQMACGSDPIGLRLAVVNKEFPNSECPNVTANINDYCFLSDTGVYLSCNILHNLVAKNFELIEYSSLESAKKAVLQNDAWALLHFNSNFSDHLAQKVIDGQSVSNETINLASIDTYVDQSNQYISHFIKSKILSTYYEVTDVAFTTCGMDSTIAGLPMRFMDPIYGGDNPTFKDYTGPSMLSLTAFYLPVLYTGAMLLFEKDGGILERVMASGMKFSEIAASHFVLQISFIVIQNFFSMILMYSRLFFNSPFEGNVLTTYVLLTSISFVGMLFGFVIALISKSQTHAAYFGIGCNFLMKFLCGMMWPTQGMDKALQIFSYFLPVTLATDALRSLGSRGWGISHPSILIGFGSTLIWIPVLLLISFIIMKRKKNWV